MADIEIVIKISEDSYKATCSGSMLPPDVKNVIDAIKNGTPLPKGHGKIGDLTKLYNEIDKRNRGKNKGKYTGILALVSFADTIIEADKGE